MDCVCYVRTRIQRIERKIVEVELRTQEELCYMELDHNTQMDYLFDEIEAFDDPIGALSYLHKRTVNELHEEQTNLRKQMQRFEADLSVEVAKSLKLTTDCLDIQRKTKEIVAAIQNLEKENAKHVVALEHLNYVQELIGNLLHRKSPFDVH